MKAARKRADQRENAGPNELRVAVRGTFAGQIGFFAMGFAWSLLTARFLGPAGRGELSILVLVPTLLIVGFDFGQESACSTLAAKSPGTRRAIHGNVTAYAGLLLLPASVLVGLAFSLLNVASSHALALAVAGGAAVAVGVYARAASGIALGSERVRVYNIFRLLSAGMLPIGVVGVATIGRSGAHAFFYIWCAAVLFGAAYLVMTLRAGTLDPSLVAAQLRTGLPIHVSNLSQVLLLRVDQLFLIVLTTRSVVGVYSVAVNVVETMWYLPIAAGLVSIPFLSGQADRDDKIDGLLHVLRVSLWLPLAGVLAMGVTAPILIPLIFGSGFVGAVRPLELLLPGVLAMGLVRVASAALIAAGETRAMWLSGGATLALNLALNALAIPVWGSSGAAVASSISYITLCALLLRSTAAAWRISLWDCVRFPDIRSGGLLARTRRCRLPEDENRVR